MRLAAVLALSLVSSAAFAGMRTVDGDPSDWAGTPSTTPHDAVSDGDEWIYTGVAGDRRTDTGMTDDADLTEVRVTADAIYLYLLVRLADIATESEVHIAVGVDTDLTNGQGFFGDDSGLTFATRPEIRPERQLALHVSAGGSPVVEWFDNANWYGIAGSQISISTTNDVVEARVPLADLNGITSTSTIRLTLATFQNDPVWNNDADATDDFNVMDAVDAMGVRGNHDNAFARDLSDADLDFAWTLALQGDAAAPTAVPFAGNPIAIADALNGSEDTEIVVSAPGLIANDDFADGLPELRAEIVDSPANGMATVGTDGSVSYLMDADENGSDSFTYRVRNATGTLVSQPIAVAVEIAAVNDAPVCAADTAIAYEDTPLTLAFSAATGNDADVEGSTLTPVLAVAPTSGLLSFGGSDFTFSPDQEFSGTVEFGYRATDGQLESAVCTFTYDVRPVNDLPFVLGETFDADEDEALVVDAVAGVLANDTDIDDPVLRAALVEAPANGTLTLATSGAFTYEPDLHFAGEDRFVYGVLDSANAPLVTGTAFVAVASVNDAPGTPAPVGPPDGTTFGPGEVSLSWSEATDVEGDALQYEVRVYEGAVPVLVRLVDDTSIALTTLRDQGEFTWTVAARDALVAGPASAPRSFTIEAGGGDGGAGCGCALAPRSRARGTALLAALSLAVAMLWRRRRSE